MTLVEPCAGRAWMSLLCRVRVRWLVDRADAGELEEKKQVVNPLTGF